MSSIVGKPANTVRPQAMPDLNIHIAMLVCKTIRVGNVEQARKQSRLLDDAYAAATPEQRMQGYNSLFDVFHKNQITLTPEFRQIAHLFLANHAAQQLDLLRAQAQTTDGSGLSAAAVQARCQQIEAVFPQKRQPLVPAAVRDTIQAPVVAAGMQRPQPLAQHQPLPLNPLARAAHVTKRNKDRSPAVALGSPVEATAQVPLPTTPKEIVTKILWPGQTPLSAETVHTLLQGLPQVSNPAQLPQYWRELRLGFTSARFPKEYREATHAFLVAHEATYLPTVIANYEREKKIVGNEQNSFAVLQYYIAALATWEHADKPLRLRAESFLNQERRLQPPQGPQTPGKFNINLNDIRSRGVRLQGIQKKHIETTSVMSKNDQGKAVRISMLTDPATGRAKGFIASTSGSGAYAKFKPIVLLDQPAGGPALAARQIRTLPQKAPYERVVGMWTETVVPKFPQNVTSEDLYGPERKILEAINSPYRPKQTFVDNKGRIYDIVELADGDLSKLGLNLSTNGQGVSDFRALSAVFPIAMKDLLGDLVKMQQQGFLHRDIKGGNVLWRRDGTFALADFGMAHSASEYVGVRGTPGYMAPESLDSTGSADLSKSDVYSLGMTFVEMLRPNGDIRGFPLSVPIPDKRYFTYGTEGYNYELQKSLAKVRSVYREWRQWSEKGGANELLTDANRADVAALNAAYAQMYAVHPEIAGQVFYHMLSPFPFQRRSAAELLESLQPMLSGPSGVRENAKGALINMMQATGYDTEVEDTLKQLHLARDRHLAEQQPA